MTTFQIIGLIVVALLGLYVFYCIYDLEKFNKKKDRRHKDKVLAVLMTLAPLFAGQQAFATTKTVTYTMGLEQQNSYTYVCLAMSGDTPFDGNSTIESQIFSYRTYANFTLADGFTFYFEWGDVTSLQNSALGFCHSDVNLKYSVRWSFLNVNDGKNYYVTNVQLTDIYGSPMNLEGGGTATTDYNYSEQQLSLTYTAAKGPTNNPSTGFFKKIVITYTDAPGLSIFNQLNDGSYQILNRFDLRHLADYVNRGQNNCSDLTFRQTKNISCDNTHTPIGHKVDGYSLVHFIGTYDGGGFTISNMNYSSSSSGDAGQDIGLFGYIEYGTVRNVVVASSTFTGFLDVGAIAGNNDKGTIQNCRVESDVTIKAGTTSAKRLGGIAGNISGSSAEIAGCICAASVTRQGWTETESFGGIVGYSYSGTIKDCLYTGTTINVNNYKGAIVGYRQAGYFSNNYYTNINLVGVNGSDMDGARRARTVTLDGNTALSGTETTYSLSNLTAIGPVSYATALRHGSTTYSGNTQNIHLTYNGTVPAGYSVTYSATAGTLNGTTLTMPNSNVTVNATLVPIPYNITYTLNGGSVATANPATYNVETETFTLNNPTKPNYDFVGWTGTGLAGPTLNVTISEGSTGDRNYTATWTPTTYNITYDLGDGSLATANPITYNIETPTFTLNNPTKTGYTFDGWTGTDLTETTLNVTIALGSTGDRSYTAHWTPISYNITYELNGGSVATANPTTYNVETATFTLNNPTRTGYTFVGWTGTDLTEATQTVTITQGSTGDRSYTATWTPTNYTITYDLDGGNVETANPTTYNVETTSFTLNNPTRTGYIFNGWTGTGLTETTMNVTITHGSTGDRSYTAHWAIDKWGLIDGADGSELHPYLITTTAGLDLLATMVNNGDSFSGKYFKLGANIEYDPNDLDENYTAIGVAYENGVHSFQGTFDGDGYTISGIRINKTGTTKADSYQGLFGYVYQGTVKNVTLSDAEITGYQYVGGIVGSSSGNITNCHVTDTVILHAVQNNAHYFGGIVGNSYGMVSDCTSAAILTVSNGKTGCGNFGGIVGFAYKQVSQCLVLGATIPTLHNNNYDDSGAIAGYFTQSDDHVFANNYYSGVTIGGATTGIGVGHDFNSNDRHDITMIDGAVAAYALTLGEHITATPAAAFTYQGSDYYLVGTTVTLSAEGYNLSGSYIVKDAQNNDVPLTDGNTFVMPASNVTVTADLNVIDFTTGHSGSMTNPYIIMYRSQLDLLAERVNSGTSYFGQYFKLEADISYPHTTDWNDASSTENNYTAIGTDGHPFQGNFDGDSHTISGIRIYKSGSNDSYQGLFGKVAIDGTVKDLTLTDARITGKNNVGGIVGNLDSYATVQHCHVSQTVAIHAVVNNAHHGGIVGHNDGTISGCTSAAALTISDDLTGCNMYGGIVGQNWIGTVQNCLAIGANVSGNYNAGAIVGNKPSSALALNNYYNGCTVNDSTGSGIGCGDPAGDLKENDGAVPCYRLTLPTALTTSNTVFNYQGNRYVAAGQTVTLTSAYEGYTIGSLTVTKDGTNPAETVAVTNNSFEMPTADVTVTATWGDLSTLWSGSGTIDDPYLITSCAQLDALSIMVNGGTDYDGTYFKLGNDISYPYATAWDDASSTENNFTAIGTNNHPFKGIFDGNGHTISGIRIYKGGSNNADDYQGLFGRIDNSNNSSYSVKDLTVSDTRITGHDYVGGIVGKNNDSKVGNCHITSSVAIHAVSNNARYHGGVVGYSNGNHYFCNSSATLSVADGVSGCSDFGGIVGYGDGGNIERCLAMDVILDGTVQKCGAIVGDQGSASVSLNFYHNCSRGNTIANIGTGDGDVDHGVSLASELSITIPGYGDGNGKWAFIASPMNNYLTPYFVKNLMATPTEHYDLYCLDQSKNGAEWQNYKAHSGVVYQSDFPDFLLQLGHGYLYASKEAVTLTFLGRLNTYSSYLISLSYTEGKPLAGYNLVGNPFPVAAYADRPYYKMNAAGTEVEPVDSYWTNPIPVCTGVVVVADGTGQQVKFSKKAPDAPTTATGNNGSLQLTLTQADTRSQAVQDKAIVSFAEGTELGKYVFNDEHAKLYIPQDGKDYAIVSAETHGEIPVNFKARENASYTLTVSPEDVDISYLHLIDNLTGADVDLLATPSYTFTARNDDYASRFKLVFSNGNQNDNDNEDFAFISNGDLIVNGKGVVQVIDLLGHILVTDEASRRISTEGLTAGVYVLRLINGENVKTQKIIVK